MYGARKGSGEGPIVLVPGGLFWTRRRAGLDFRRVVPDTHDYFLRRPKAGRLHPSSKGCTRTLTIYGDARSMVGGPAARWDGVSKSCTRTPTL